MMRFAQWLPVLFTPEQVLCFRYRQRVAGLQRVFKFVGLDVVNDCRCRDAPLLFTHIAERMLLKKPEPRFIPATAIDARFFHK